jgi:Zn-finger nucleic acid-binding protein
MPTSNVHLLERPSRMVANCVPVCPRDSGSLNSFRTREVDALQCDHCRGLWLPPETVARALGHAVPSAPRLVARSSARCPCDGDCLTPVRAHGIEIDVCPSCRGVWLDRGELDRILGSNRVRPGTRLGSGLGSDAPDLALEGPTWLGEAACEVVIEVVAGILSGW